MRDREPEIESLASRTSSAALQLRFAQNDKKGAHASTLRRPFEVLDRLLDAFLELNSRFPTEDFFRAGDVRLADLRIVHRQGFVFNCRFGPGNPNDFLCEL